jgi:hypothetical protein
MFLIGILAAMGANYLWEIFKLPGYDMRVFNLPTTTHPTSFGADDLLLIGIGAIIIILGRKNREIALFGIGWIFGIVLTKILEMENTNTAGLITPGSFALS